MQTAVTGTPVCSHRLWQLQFVPHAAVTYRQRNDGILHSNDVTWRSDGGRVAFPTWRQTAYDYGRYAMDVVADSWLTP